MIEKTVLDYLKTQVSPVPVYMEVPKNPPEKMVVLERTGGSVNDHLKRATFAVQSYAGTLYEAAALNETVIDNLLAITTEKEVCASRLNSFYNYTDTTSKRYRYQAVFDFVHY